MSLTQTKQQQKLARVQREMLWLTFAIGFSSGLCAGALIVLIWL